MIEQDKKIRKGLPPRRDVACYQVQQDIVIPAGTILRHTGDGEFYAQVGTTGEFTITIKPGENPVGFKRVIA